MLADPSLRLLVPRSTRTSSGSVLVLLAFSGLAILGLVFLAAIWAGKESDAAALDRQRQLVNSRLLDQVRGVSQDIQLMGAGYASLLLADSAMASGKHERAGATSAAAFGKIATTVFGYNAAFLVTPAGELALESDPETSRRFKWVRPLLQPMIQDLEAKQHGTPQGSTSDPQPSRVELMRLEGRPSVAGVVSVKSSSNTNQQQGNDANGLYLVAFRFLDGVTLDTLSREQGLAGARYARTADQEQDEVAFQIEATASGEPIGFIIWTPDLPGSRVIGRLVPILSIAGLVIVGLFFALMGRLRRSLRELSASEHHARHLSLHDVLTGLPNRALFAARLEQCLASMKSPGRRSVLALVDLDKFKEVNDIHGHAAGDELLRGVVDRMNALIEPGDTLARLGGDEFALLLPDAREGDDSHILLCNTIIGALSKPFQLRDGDIVVRIGCSIGIAAFHDAAQASSEILRRADVALYEAKTNGRGRLVEYDPSLDHRVEARENLKNDLRLVLADHAHLPDSANNASSIDPGRLEVFFQGVHRADAHGRLSGAEALLRWRHPTLGLLSPDKFIPIAEEAGMIDQLGHWVLRSAAEAAAGWPADMSVAVNVSPSQIRHRDFDHHVLSILAETGLPPSRLELELTEAALFNIDEDAQATLGKLRSRGIRIALDDFGTGFSSLSHLIQFNIDRIKIDRSFVRLLGTQAEGAAIVSAILGLSRTLGKATTAEGVETEGQRDFLVAAGCNDLQGFLFSRPMPLADFLPTIRSTKAAAQVVR
ncbi:diguanylate cyclase (GGDEF)-like protein [Rhizobium sp. BK650]|uniref:putative bifunctional diguanylate cyclase/phosphodiesterase n=1 Tax=Rhizobium sp. BK650 TaxID=2586990 RepID=UPI0017C602CD|nr:EAL domain-containing protein [Rhizobium sp. BK650]MBB3659170.1 diguanylate cyclase (GGDEF)-like protein [Rhizobium sp. BK650]